MQQSKDYLEREIERLSVLLIGLIEKISGSKSENTQDNLDEVSQALKGELDLSISEISQIESSELLNHLSNLQESHIQQLVELLYQLYVKSEQLDMNKSKIAEKAILLIDYLNENSNTFSLERMDMKNELKQNIL
jgi:hypothetical protein